MTYRTAQLVLMVGLPGSGKSTYAKENFPEHIILSSDANVQKIADDLGKTYDEVWDKHIGMADKKFFDDLNSYIQAGANIVVDRTNLSKRSRTRVLAPLITNKRAADYNVKVVLMNPELTTIKARLGDRKDKTISPGVLTSMRSLFEVPEEGKELIDEVIEVNED